MKISGDEELLLAACLERNRFAIDKLSLMYGVPLFGFLRSALGARAHLAQNFVTESIVEFLRCATPFNLSEPIHVTLARSILQKVEKQLKSKNSEGPLAGLDRKLSVVFDCLSQLSWKERILLLLRDQMEFSLEEMSAVLSLSKMKIRSSLKDARLKLRENLQSALAGKISSLK